jgi:integrase
MGNIDDPQGFEDELDAEKRRLEESTQAFEVDKPEISRFVAAKRGSVAVSSLAVYCRRLRLASARANNPLVEMDDLDDFYAITSALRDHGLGDSTISSYENVLILFAKRRLDAEWTDDVNRTDPDDSGPDADDILEPADIQSLTSAARRQRDVAFIEFLADTGARLSLALSLRVGDVSFNDDRGTYTPNPDATGLKGAPIREYPLIDSVAPLRGYLRGSHPRPDDEDVALFHKIKPARRTADERWGDAGGVDPNAMRQQLYRIADRADVETTPNPHAFRHAAITRMVREGYSRSQIEHRVAWELDTDMWDRYEHVTEEQHNSDIFAEAGVATDDDGPDRVRRPCGNCGDPLAPHHDFCASCGAPATAEAEAQVEDAKGTVLEDLVEATNPQTRREVRALIESIEEQPANAHDDSSR